MTRAREIRTFSMRSPPLVADRRSLAITDLASGTGSTLRAISSRLPRRQRWRLVDHDPELLERASSALAAGRRCRDGLRRYLIEVKSVLRERADLVTASALLDLVSDDWLDRLTRVTVRAPVAWSTRRSLTTGG